MYEEWSNNYGPGGHAEQVRNRLWGRTEPTAAILRSLNGMSLLVGDYGERFPQLTGSVEPEPGLEPAEPEPTTSLEHTDPEYRDTEPTDPDRDESEPIVSESTVSEPTEPERKPTEPESEDLEPEEPELSSELDSPADESEGASSSSDSEQRKRPVRKRPRRKRRSRKPTSAMGREVAANVPRRSRKKSRNPAENGADSYMKGQIRSDPTEDLQQRETEDDQWKNAVYHESIRSQLFDQAGPFDQYRELRKSGYGEHNKTAFCDTQRDWSSDRNEWSLIQDNILNQLERNEYGLDQQTELGPMMWGTRVVIDNDNHIIIDYDIPLTLSTEYEGQHMETSRRLIPGLQTRDFWARMPRYSGPPNAQNPTGILTKMGKLSNRQCQFRRKNGLLAWKNRQGTSTMRDLLIAELSEQQKMDNTTEGFKGLSKAQLRSLALASKDSPSSAGKRKYHEERKRREAKDQKDEEEGSDEESDFSSPVQKKVCRRRKGPNSDA